MLFLRASTASGRGKLRRQASPTRREGTGRAKGRMRMSSPGELLALTDVAGSTVTPTPLATMCRMVSSEPPSIARVRAVWQNSST